MQGVASQGAACQHSSKSCRRCVCVCVWELCTTQTKDACTHNGLYTGVMCRHRHTSRLMCVTDVRHLLFTRCSTSNACVCMYVCVCVCAQGTDITKGLRKVTDDMKTKNRTDRSGFVSIPVKDKAPADGPGGATAAGGAGAKPAAPPRCEYDGERKKWIVENQVCVCVCARACVRARFPAMH